MHGETFLLILLVCLVLFGFRGTLMFIGGIWFLWFILTILGI